MSETPNHPAAHPLPEGVYDNFTYACKDCGGTITVVSSTRQPHTCQTTERDELAEVVANFRDDWYKVERRPPAGIDRDEASALLAAGYRKPRQVTTVEELDALPVGSVVLSDAYRYMVHGGADCGWPVSFQKWTDGDWHRGARSGDTHPDNFLPATVLHVGGAE